MTRQDTGSAVMVGDDGTPAETVTLPPKPDPNPETEAADGPADHRSEPDPAPESDRAEQQPTTRDRDGIPAGQMAVAGVAVVALGEAGLYQLAGPMGAVAGAAVLAAGGYGAYRLRHGKASSSGRDGQDRPSKGQPKSRRRAGTSGGIDLGSIGRSSRRSRKGRSGGGDLLPGVGRGAARRARGLLNRGAATGSGGGGTSRLGRPTRAGRAGKGGAPATAASKSEGRRRPWSRAAAACGRAARRARDAGRNLDARVNRGVQRAVERSIAPGRRAFARIRPYLARFGRWADTRTGNRLSRIVGKVRASAWFQRATAALRRHAPTAETTETASTPAATAATAPAQTTPTAPRASTITRSWSAPAHVLPGAPMTFPLITHATEMPTIAAAYQSDDMMDVKSDLELLRELPLQAATSVRLLTERLAADYPINPDVIEAAQRLYEALSSCANEADELSVTFNGSHADDIKRRLTPRVNEHLWNARR